MEKSDSSITTIVNLPKIHMAYLHIKGSSESVTKEEVMNYVNSKYKDVITTCEVLKER